MSEKMETGLTGWPAGAAWRQRKALRPQPWASAGERTVSTPRRRRGGGMVKAYSVFHAFVMYAWNTCCFMQK